MATFIYHTHTRHIIGATRPMSANLKDRSHNNLTYYLPENRSRSGYSRLACLVRIHGPLVVDGWAVALAGACGVDDEDAKAAEALCLLDTAVRPYQGLLVDPYFHLNFHSTRFDSGISIILPLKLRT